MPPAVNFVYPGGSNMTVSVLGLEVPLHTFYDAVTIPLVVACFFLFIDTLYSLTPVGRFARRLIDRWNARVARWDTEPAFYERWWAKWRNK